MRYRIDLPDPEATLAWGRLLGTRLWPGAIIYLSGTLGAGKTSLCRGVLAALGHAGPVKSPTYTLVEPYTLTHGNVYHFDLYRLEDLKELHDIGFIESLDLEGIKVVEWADRFPQLLDCYNWMLEFSIPCSECRKIKFYVSS